MMRIENVMSASPVIAVLTITDVRHAAPLARALLFGGVSAMEVTLRTPVALEAIKVIADEVPEALVGASTIMSPRDLDAAYKAGAAFAASPGAPIELMDVGVSSPLPYLPGVSTATELMAAYERGYEHVKFFPAAAAGGVAMLKALAGPFAGVKFCATGGVTRQSAPHYLAQPNVACVGGSWLAPTSLVEAGDWEAIENVARATIDDLSLAPHSPRKPR
jgi:2-dehydro-3-deoxyphosphogluconate aldolase/(4S)-4-hydroxy-2-oxoglutarate aldolase